MKVTNLFARGSSAILVKALAVAITLYFVLGPVPTADAQKFRFFDTLYSDWALLVVGGDGKVNWKILKNENPSHPPGILREIPFGESETDVIPNSGDYTGDGLDDYVIYRDNSGLIPPINTYIIGRSDGGATQWTQYGDWETDFVGAEGDYDGDNKMDLTIQRQVSGKLEWWVLRSSTNTISVFYWGSTFNTDIPLGGADYTGDGIDDPAVVRINGTTGAVTWYVGTTAGTGITQLQWGNYNTDWIVPGGDYDGDGKADFMLWRGFGNGVWYLRTAAGATTYTQFGIPDSETTESDLALRGGDYDGDGKTDIALYRPSDNAFWVYRSSGGGGQYQKFGAAGEDIVPLANFGVY